MHVLSKGEVVFSEVGGLLLKSLLILGVFFFLHVKRNVASKHPNKRSVNDSSHYE